MSRQEYHLHNLAVTLQSSRPVNRQVFQVLSHRQIRPVNPLVNRQDIPQVCQVVILLCNRPVAPRQSRRVCHLRIHLCNHHRNLLLFHLLFQLENQVVIRPFFQPVNPPFSHQVDRLGNRLLSPVENLRINLQVYLQASRHLFPLASPLANPQQFQVGNRLLNQAQYRLDAPSVLHRNYRQVNQPLFPHQSHLISPLVSLVRCPVRCHLRARVLIQPEFLPVSLLDSLLDSQHRPLVNLLASQRSSHHHNHLNSRQVNPVAIQHPLQGSRLENLLVSQQ